MQATAKAHTNIALIKYWGKRDEKLITPMNNSLSLTLDGFYTTTTVEFNEDRKEDTLILDEEQVHGEAYQRVTDYINFIRTYVDRTHIYAHVNSINAIHTDDGITYSHSRFATIVAAVTGAV